MAEERAPDLQTTPGRDVFISYASPDRAVADAVCAALEAAGVTCWIAPRDVTPGEFYAESIVHALDSSKVIVLVLSQHAADSNHVLREVERASSKRHPVVSLRVDVSPLPAGLEYFLNTSQWLDASATGVDRAMPRLVDAVRSALALPSSAAHVKAGSTAAARLARRPTRVLAVLTTIIVAALGYSVVDKFWLSKHVSTAAGSVSTGRLLTPSIAISDKSIAVLPFVDMSEKHDQEYFSDGISEELIDHLAHIPDLKVIARTSAFAFKGKNEDMRTIGQRLGVANLLEGSVRTSGQTVRVTTQLIKVSDGSHLWSQTYDRDMRDIFKVQDAIAVAVVTALQATLATSSARERPVSTKAYKAVLRGRYFNQMGTKEDSERAITAYREAIRIEPSYAIAYAELANTYSIRGSFAWMPIKEAYTEARAAIDRSLGIDPTVAIAHRVLGWLERDYKFDFVTARAEQKRADELDPTDPLVVDDAGTYAFIAGHLDEAIRLYRQLAERDPLDTDAWGSLWWSYIRANRLTEAEAAARTRLELNPRAKFAHAALAWVLLYEHKPDAALEVARQETEEADRLTCLSDVLWALGRRSEADALLAEIKAKHGYSQAVSLAGRYAIRNEKDEAFMWLDRAYENREPETIYIRTDEALRNLYGDPRWQAFLRKMNLPE